MKPLYSFLLLLFSNYIIAQAPVITSLSGSQSAVGSTVQIYGSNFSATPSANTVYFGGVIAPITAAATNQLSVTVPQGAGYGSVAVTVAGLTGVSSQSFSTSSACTYSIAPGTFASATTLTASAPGYPYVSAVADLDGDGKQDLLSSNNGSNSFSCTFSAYRNTSAPGNISFAAPVSKSTSSSSVNLSCGDLDGDGKQDVAVANIGGNSIQAFLNDGTIGTISFTNVVSRTVPSACGIAIGDLDTDGKPEIISGSYFAANGLSIFANYSTPGNLSLAVSPYFINTGNVPIGIKLADIDNDGKPEIIAADAATSQIVVLKNNSTPGSFSFVQYNFATGNLSQATVIEAGDLDGDGKTDIAYCHTGVGDTQLGLLRNTSAGGAITFAPEVTLSAPATYIGLCLGDLNGDGKADIAASGLNATVWSVYENNSTTGVFSFNRTDFNMPSIGAWNLSVADFDGDLRNDVAIPHTTPTANVTVFKNSPSLIAPVVSSLSALQAAPGSSITITGNNFNPTDKVFFGGVSGAVLSASATQLTVLVPYGAAYGSVTVTNLCGLSATSLSQFTPADNCATTGLPLFSASQQFATSSERPYDIAAADFDGDGLNDIAEVNYTGNSVGVFRNTTLPNQPVTFGAPLSFSVLGNPDNITVFDIDGDGKLDIVMGQGNYTASLRYFRNTSTLGNISFVTGTVAIGFIPAEVKGGDIDKDGKIDLIASGSSIYIFKNNSTPGNVLFAAPVSYPFSAAVNPVDLDDDGWLDLVGSNYGSNAVTAVRNNGTGLINAGTFATAQNFTTANNPFRCAIGDLDNDGKIDVAINSWSSTFISVLKNTSSAGTISFATKVDYNTFPQNYSDIAIGDLTGDGKLEIAGITSYTLKVLKNVSTTGVIDASSFSILGGIGINYGAWQLSIADMDNDSKNDVISANDITIANGTPSFTVNKNIYASPVANISPANPVIVCSGSSATLDAGAGYTSYAWSNGSNTQTVSVNTAGNYSVTVNGCPASADTVTVIVNAPSISTSSPLCGNPNYGLTLNNAGTGAKAVAWKNGGTIVQTNAATYNTTATTFAGGNGTSYALNVTYKPGAIAFDKYGNLYVPEVYNNRVTKFPANSNSSTQGQIVATGSSPTAVAFDSYGNFYVCEYANHRVLRFTPGNPAGTIVAGSNGAGFGANQLNSPTGVYIDAADNLYVADYANHRIQKFPYNSTQATNGTTVIGGNGYGSGLNQLAYPVAVTQDPLGNFYVTDYNNGRITKFPSTTTSSTNGVVVAGGNGFGSALNQLNGPEFAIVDRTGFIYVADYLNHRIMRFPPNSTSATNGTSIAGSYGTGPTQLNGPDGMAMDAAGNLYVSDYFNYRIQKFDVGTLNNSFTATTAGTYTAEVEYSSGCVYTTNALTFTTPPTWYLDADGDNYYTGAGIVQCSSPGLGYTTAALTGGGDCNDNNAAVNPGAIEICSNGIDDNCNGITDEGCGPYIITWTGSTSNNWNTAANWSPGFVPTAVDSVIIPFTTNQPVVTANAFAKGLQVSSANVAVTINNGITLSVAGNISGNTNCRFTGGFVNLSGTAKIISNAISFDNLSISGTLSASNTANIIVLNTLQINDGVLAANGKVTLRSNALGTARIAPILSGNITGNVIQERYIAPGSPSYEYLACGVAGQTINALKDDITVVLGNPASVQWYNEILPGDKTAFGWTSFTNSSSVLPAYRGFAAYMYARPKTIDFIGTPYKGLQNIPVSYTNTGAPTEDGFNLVANPYLSDIDWDAPTGWVRNNIDPAIYILNPATNNNVSYNHLTNIGTGGFNGKIASGQSFFVQATGTSPVLSLDENVKTSGATFYKNDEQINSYVRISVLSENGNGDEMLLGFAPNATKGFDKELDVVKNGRGNVDIALLTTKGEKLTQQFIDAGNDNDVIPVAFNTNGETCKFTISFGEAANVQGDIYLRDNLTGTLTDIHQSTAYTFDITANNIQANASRFDILIGKPEESNAVSNFSAVVYPNPAQGKVNIRLSGVTGEASVSIYDVVGKLVYSQQILQNNFAEINTSDFESGVYMVEVKDDVTRHTERLIINK